MKVPLPAAEKLRAVRQDPGLDVWTWKRDHTTYFTAYWWHSRQRGAHALSLSAARVDRPPLWVWATGEGGGLPLSYITATP